MPRRNVYILGLVAIACVACAMRASIYSQVLQFATLEIQRRALEPKSTRELTEDALHGMAERLDPYSSYIDSAELEEFKENLDRQFGGVGVEVILDPETEQPTVVCPLIDTPAHRAGIRAGDRIVSIDGEPTKGRSLEEAAERMRGEPGEPVTLEILHPGDDDPVELEIVRQIIQADTVLGDTRNPDGSWNYLLSENPNIAHVRITTFADETDEQLRSTLSGLRDEGVDGLVLDLRNNPGGRLDVACQICDMFIDSGVIVSTRYRGGVVKDQYRAAPGGAWLDLPLVVLVNRHSASASEIVAACLQDHQRAAVAGERSFGKGTVQELIELLPGLGMLKLTTATYWRPSGKNIHRHEDAEEDDEWGVAPDEELECRLDDEEMKSWLLGRALRDMYREPGAPLPEGFEDAPEEFHDRQRDLALEHLKERIATERSRRQPTRPRE